MKKLLGILVLGFLWFNYSFAETIVMLPKDTASGYKKLSKEFRLANIIKIMECKLLIKRTDIL